jgi:hypothetical protein
MYPTLMDLLTSFTENQTWTSFTLRSGQEVTGHVVSCAEDYVVLLKDTSMKQYPLFVQLAAIDFFKPKEV